MEKRKKKKKENQAAEEGPHPIGRVGASCAIWSTLNGH